MANLTETPQWEPGIYQLETTDPVLGGPEGISNRAARELGNRTAYLKQEVELRAPLASPALTGQPTAPTAAAGESSTQLANTAWVAAALARLVDGAPETMATLNKLATMVQTLAPRESPVLSGIPTAPTASPGTQTGQLATTAFVQTAIAALVSQAPGTLDTLNELAQALGNDADFAATMTRLLATKAPLASPQLTGTPTAPTAAVGTSTPQLATTAFVLGQAATQAPGKAGVAAVGSSTRYAREDHVHPESTNQTPPGILQYCAASAVPPGRLKANGAAVSRTTYAALFAAIGTSYGAGDGSTTFNLPDLRGEFLRGWDEGRGADPGRGFGTWQGSQNVSHAHSGSTSVNGNHTHQVAEGHTKSNGANLYASGDDYTEQVFAWSNTTASGDHAHSFVTAADGGNEARPRNVAMLICITY